MSKANMTAPPAQIWLRVGGTGLIVGLVTITAANVVRYDPPRNAPIQIADQVLATAGGLSALDTLPAITESLMGTSVRPLTLIVIARDTSALSDTMAAAGWNASAPPTPGMVLDAIYAAIGGSEDPTVETVSLFWRTEYVTTDGLRVFVGTVRRIWWRRRAHSFQRCCSDPALNHLLSQVARSCTSVGELAQSKLVFHDTMRLFSEQYGEQTHEGLYNGVADTQQGAAA